MLQSLLKTAKISCESFILIYGIWTIASHIAMVFQLSFSWLGTIFLVLFAVSILALFISGFFKDWKIQHPDQEKFNTD